MPKKSRRGRAKHKRRGKLAQSRIRELRQHLEPVSLPSRPVPSVRVPAGVADIGARYQYVLVELRRIGIIAGAMFLFLLILSFFLR